MTERTICTLFARALVAATLCAAVFAPAASAADPDHRLRLYVAGTETDVGGVSTGRGAGVDWELLFGPRVGVAVGVFSSEIEEWFGDDEFRMTPVTAAALFHLTPGRAVDFYVGPGVAWVEYSGRAGDSYDFDEGIDPMVQLGFDVRPNGSRVGFNFQLKHILGGDTVDHDDDDCHDDWWWCGDGRDDWDGHSVTVSAGVTFRF